MQECSAADNFATLSTTQTTLGEFLEVFLFVILYLDSLLNMNAHDIVLLVSLSQQAKHEKEVLSRFLEVYQHTPGKDLDFCE